MPQLSKKKQIAGAALPVFLENGIKGTSVDMVVRASQVSKPTVYNHFPDKASLFDNIIETWIQEQPAPVITATSLDELWAELDQLWLKDDALRLYGIFLGEGFRAKKACRLFVQKYDQAWRSILASWAEDHGYQSKGLTRDVSDRILKALLSI